MKYKFLVNVLNIAKIIIDVVCWSSIVIMAYVLYLNWNDILIS